MRLGWSSLRIDAGTAVGFADTIVGGSDWHVGCPHHSAGASALFRDPVDGSRSDTVDGAVTRMLILASLLSVGLFIYLVIALLKPEWFV
jgi:K+-transporting ATPase KdpF subunit